MGTTAWLFQSTHPVWGATYLAIVPNRDISVSIHAPRVGCDRPLLSQLCFYYVSIHAPRVGCDRGFPRIFGDALRFNPRTPCGVRRFGLVKQVNLVVVSIHAPRVGCDTHYTRHSANLGSFNPRTPCGVRLLNMVDWTQLCVVSIHAPRVGCDAPPNQR